MLSKRDRYLRKVIKSAHTLQDYLWGELNTKWDLEEWRAMLRKRIVKLDEIDTSNPHHIIELKKRIVQIAAISVNFLNELDKNHISTEKPITNLDKYRNN